MVLRAYTITGMFSYILDLCLRYASGTLVDQGCSVGFTMHHVVALVIMGVTLTIKYLPAAVAMPWSMHAYLITFPQVTLLNYVYLAMVAAAIYQIYQNPFKYMPKYRNLQVIWLLLPTLVVLWFFDCSNHLI
eukprot:TRINITY_DN5467_c0_g1_i1.p1 TRINITY_DN5467_c0_g1~~TRINITY_DN5467_c0_g1_i1.p1  ORF type:complete len:132 (-),score=9.79 TRINITY_DN5467_c0_g1_i1:37-432(-)